MTAAALLREAGEAGISARIVGPDLALSAARPPSPDLLNRLRAAKPELLALLGGEVCRHCGEPVSWSRPGVVAFADGTGAHVDCYERADAPTNPQPHGDQR